MIARPTATAGTTATPPELQLQLEHLEEFCSRAHVVSRTDEGAWLWGLIAGVASSGITDPALRRDLPSGPGSTVVLVDGCPDLPEEISRTIETVERLVWPFRHIAEAVDWQGQTPDDARADLYRDDLARAFWNATTSVVTQNGEPATRQRLPDPNPLAILSGWRRHGPLVHQPTGITTLDEMTGGGPTFGDRMFVLGAPDAGKTALLVQVADKWLHDGIAVGLLAADETRDDVLTRFLQRRGWSRQECEARSSEFLDAAEAELRRWPLLVFDGQEYSIEQAAGELARLARDRGMRAGMFVDSLQTARSEVEGAASSKHDVLTGRVHAIRRAAERHRMAVLATSEVVRAAYRSRASADEQNPMAFGKESGSIEYGARLMVVLKNVEGDGSVVEMLVAKNKLGPSPRAHRAGERGVFLRVDRSRQAMLEQPGYEPPAPVSIEPDRSAEAAAMIATVLADRPGMGKNEIQAATGLLARSTGRDGIGATLWPKAIELLAPALRVVDGRNNKRHHYIDGSKLPPEVFDEVQVNDRPKVQNARHAAGGSE